jgi:putative ATP-dependent endonuclease of OLD family
LNADVALDHKQVIIGKNNVEKTNFLRAIQLILDDDYSDSDSQLTPEDFYHSIEKPMENGEEIKINLEIKRYEHNSKLRAQFVDTVIADDPPAL